MNIKKRHPINIAFFKKLIPLFIQFFWISLFSSCGYHFQNTHNPLAEREGVRKVFISPIKNSTFQVGLEDVVYHHLIKTLAMHRRVVLVGSIHDADAVLQGVVGLASSNPSKTTSVSGLIPGGLGSGLPLNMSTFQIANEYVARLSCSFELNRVNPAPRQRVDLWKGSFERSKPFAGSNQLDVPGTTSPLIHQSEFERALSDLAASMMEDLHENMLAGF